MNSKTLNILALKIDGTKIMFPFNKVLVCDIPYAAFTGMHRYNISFTWLPMYLIKHNTLL